MSKNRTIKVSYLKYFESKDPAPSKKALVKRKILDQYHDLKAAGCSDSIICKTLDVSRAAIYRWKSRYNRIGIKGLENASRIPYTVPVARYTPEVIQLVLRLRQQNPIWGKAKIHKILIRDYHMSTSVSTIGRILKLLVAQGKIKPASFYFGRLKVKRPRRFTGHSRRWKHGMQAEIPGELIQIDHAVVEIGDGRYVKQFDATCPVTKLTVSQVYTRATSKIAQNFLDYAQAQFPFQIRSIQVDGGSEFRGDFEQTCADRNIELYVLPPKSPEYNGNIERRHGTIKYEFFAVYDGELSLEKIRAKLAQYMLKYNHYRPHQALNFDTPWDFFLKLGK